MASVPVCSPSPRRGKSRVGFIFNFHKDIQFYNAVLKYIYYRKLKDQDN